MTETAIEQPTKRKLLKMIASLPCVTACAGTRPTREDELVHRFDGKSFTLVVDAVSGAEMEGVVFYDDRGYTIYAKSLVARRTREILSLSNPRIPLTVRVLWRHDPTPVWGRTGGIDYQGTIAGDYTVPVAERIPDEVVKEIGPRRGGLRLKFRLKPDGVLFGWDVERPDIGLYRFDMPGGDFLETRY